MAIEIIGTGRAVPPRRVSNDEIATRIDTTDEWIRSHTGIGNRHVSGDDIACSDLALIAAKNALAMSAGYTGTDADEVEKAAAKAAETIDVILIATATPDHYGCPSVACIVQGKLGAVNAAAFDITVSCTGFAYGLEIVAGLLNIREERKRALVIGSDLLTKVTNWEDRSTCILFGDGAGAVVVEKTDAPSTGSGRRGVVQGKLWADGTGMNSIIMKNGGTRNPYKKGDIVEKAIYLEMNGQEVYNFAVGAISKTIKALLEADGITADDVTRIVPHQANARIVQAAARRLRIPMEKFYLNIEEYANTSSASIPIALDELNRNGQLKKGDIVLTVGFGGGLAYGGNIIIW